MRRWVAEKEFVTMKKRYGLGVIIAVLLSVLIGVAFNVGNNSKHAETAPAATVVYKGIDYKAEVAGSFTTVCDGGKTVIITYTFSSSGNPEKAISGQYLVAAHVSVASGNQYDAILWKGPGGMENHFYQNAVQGSELFGERSKEDILTLLEIEAPNFYKDKLGLTSDCKDQAVKNWRFTLKQSAALG